jgi:hypothetical protein
MILTIVAIWAVVIPVVILAVSWQITRPRPTHATHTAHHGRSLPPCALPAARPRRTVTRRACPELPRRVRRRPASAS